MKNFSINKLIISFILVLVFPIVTGSVIYTNAVKITEENAHIYNKALLVGVQEAMDSQIEKTNIIMNHFAANKQVVQLATVSGEITPAQILEMRTLMDYLASYKSISSIIVEYYLYFFNSGRIITSSALYNEELFYNNMQNPFDITFNDWKAGLASTPYFLSYGKALTGMPVLVIPHLNLIECRQSVPIPFREGANAVLVLLIDQNKLSGMLNNINLSKDGVVYIIDSNDTIIASTGSNIDCYIPHSLLSGTEGNLYSSENSDDVIFYRSSNVLDWKYVSVIPKDSFLNQVSLMQVLAYQILAICIAVGLIMIFFLSHINYKPIKNLIGQNELLLKKEADMEDVLTQHKETVIDNLILKMCKSSEPDIPDIITSLKSYEIDFAYGYFCVIIIKAKIGVKDISLEDILLNKTTNIKYFHEVYTNDGDMVCLMQLNNNYMHKFDESINPTSSIGISRIHDNAKYIPMAYLEAVKAVEYSMIHNVPFAYFEDTDRGFKYFYYPLEIELSIINNAKAGAYDNVCLNLDTVYKKNADKHNLPAEYVRCLILDMSGTIIKLTNELGINESIKVGFDFFTYPKPFQDYFEHIREIYREICLHVNKNKKSHNETLRDNLKDYITENCFNPEISVNYIADIFNITPTYLSSFFKEQTGQNLLDYINRLRIEKGKEYLKNTSFNIADIAVKLGFVNDAAFARSFKKYEGTTPSNYRQALIK